MSSNRETPGPDDGQFWIDLPHPAARPDLPDQDATAEAPAISGDDPGAIFASNTAPQEPLTSAEDVPPADEPAAAVAVEAEPSPQAEPLPELPPAAPESASPQPVGPERAFDAQGDPMAVDPDEEVPPLEDEGMAAFVPVILGGALALAVAVGLEAAGLWSTLLPP